jgi:phosphate uptake regulator
MARGQGSAQGGTAREQFREAKDQVVSQTRQALQQARNRAGSSLAESKEQLADQVESIASVFRRTADQLREEDRRTIASITDAVARQADQAGTYLRRIDARAAREDLEDITRRRPALVLGGAAALGLIAARFFKSSEGGGPGHSPPAHQSGETGTGPGGPDGG